MFRCALVWICLAASAASRDLFVSNVAGDDRREGTSARSETPERGPVRTISKALRLAQAGDRIVVENTGQPYRESLSLTGSRHSGSLIRPLIIDAGGAVLDGSVPISGEQWEHHRGEIFSYQPARLGYQQLFLEGRPLVRRPASWAEVALPRLDPLEWCFWRGKIYFCVEPRRLPEQYALSCCGLQTGVTLYYVHNVLIRDLVVQGFQLDGVAIHDVVRDTRLARVTSWANGASGISVRGASRVELDGCQLAANGRSQLRVDDFARVWLYQCELIDDTGPTIERRGGQVTIDPKPFASAALRPTVGRRSP